MVNMLQQHILKFLPRRDIADDVSSGHLQEVVAYERFRIRNVVN